MLKLRCGNIFGRILRFYCKLQRLDVLEQLEPSGSSSDIQNTEIQSSSFKRWLATHQEKLSAKKKHLENCLIFIFTCAGRQNTLCSDIKRSVKSLSFSKSGRCFLSMPT